MISMNRLVRQLNSDKRSSAEASSRAFEHYSEVPNLILLGDPGAGKTHLFEEAAAKQKGRYLKARTFMTLPSRFISGEVLFIDGLDEKRSGRGDRDTIDALVVKLFATAPAKVRISCRVADWLGESDLAALGPYIDQHGKAPVLLLEALTLGEQFAVLTAQGLSAGDAEKFLSEARTRRLDEFLGNPQSLILLWTAVGAGMWPEARRELFEISTHILLREAGPEHARAGVGVYTSDDLRAAAGAICAARLISDVDGISLRDQEGTPDCPSYRTLSFLDQNKTIAALGRRVFGAGPVPESVDYIHRTAAEYLGAAFLATQIRSGLPLARVMALVGVDGIPASELRGLHAWLAVHLSEHADWLIERDPYAVLIYGDAASLTPSSCARLIRALAKLAADNPWFRRERGQLPSSVGALARRDMVDEMRSVLRDPAAGPGVRSIVIDALWLGDPRAELIPDLTEVLGREDCSYLERQRALLALLRLGEEAKRGISGACRNGLGNSDNAIRIRVEILKRLYGEGFGVADVVGICTEMAARPRPGAGLLWKLEEAVPVADLPAILDGIEASRRGDSETGLQTEVGAFYTRALARVWDKQEALEPQRLLRWLRTSAQLHDSYERARAEELREATRRRPERSVSVADEFLSNLIPGESWWPSVVRFRESLPELSSTTLLPIVLNHLDQAELSTDRRPMLFELALILSWQADQPEALSVFERLMAMSEREPGLAAIQARLNTLALPERYFDACAGQANDTEGSRKKQREEFAGRKELIHCGEDLQWLTHLARIYFALYSDVDSKLSSRDRIAEFFDSEVADIASAGFQAALSRSDLPTLDHVIELTANHQHKSWWLVLVAGLDEQWAVGRGLGILTEDAIAALIAFDLANPVICIDDGEKYFVHPWKRALLDERPNLVAKSYLAVARARLSRRDLHVDGLNELLTEVEFAPFGAETALQLLQDYPACTEFQLSALLDAVCWEVRTRPQVQALASTVLSGTVAVPDRQRDLWLAAAFFIAPVEYENEVEQRVRVVPHFIFDLRNRSGAARLRSEIPEAELPLTVLEFLIRLVGTIYPVTAPPEKGWTGDTNPWDATEYCVSLINRLSAQVGHPAGLALRRLLANSNLASYRSISSMRSRTRSSVGARPSMSDPTGFIRCKLWPMEPRRPLGTCTHWPSSTCGTSMSGSSTRISTPTSCFGMLILMPSRRNPSRRRRAAMCWWDSAPTFASVGHSRGAGSAHGSGQASRHFDSHAGPQGPM